MTDEAEALAIPDSALALSREPQIVLEEAHRAAKALKDVIDKKPNPVKFSGEQYLEYEDWQVLGRFYGIAPVVTGSRLLTIGDATGWEATANAVHVPTGRVVSSADAMCMTDEPKWGARPKYEFVYLKKSGGHSVEDPGPSELIWEQGTDGKRRPKKMRMQTGVESVPSFQLRSMAQTRSCAKALRNALAWVVVLAGYRPTPAEEMPDYYRAVPPPPPPRAEVEDAEVTSPRVEPVREEEAPALDDDLTRSLQLARIKGLADKLKMKAADRAKLWVDYVGDEVDPREAATENLTALYTALKRLAQERGVGAPDDTDGGGA